MLSIAKRESGEPSAGGVRGMPALRPAEARLPQGAIGPQRRPVSRMMIVRIGRAAVSGGQWVCAVERPFSEARDGLFEMLLSENEQAGPGSIDILRKRGNDRGIRPGADRRPVPP
jgi:hypothetical protein